MSNNVAGVVFVSHPSHHHGESDQQNWLGAFDTTPELIAKILDKFTEPGHIVIDLSRKHLPQISLSL